MAPTIGRAEEILASEISIHLDINILRAATPAHGHLGVELAIGLERNDDRTLGNAIETTGLSIATLTRIGDQNVIEERVERVDLYRIRIARLKSSFMFYLYWSM